MVSPSARHGAIFEIYGHLVRSQPIGRRRIDPQHAAFGLNTFYALPNFEWVIQKQNLS